MYQINLRTPDNFLSQYWQKQPLLIREGFTNFSDPIFADELAGLGLEKDVNSRVISNVDQQWQVRHGPFDDYAEFGEQNWSLLVQGVNYLVPETQKLVNAFSFIPQWRLEDLMVSFSTPKGGVGPHTDQYDVFIIQGMGKRRWQVGSQTSPESFEAAKDLLHVDAFDPVIDEILETGDVLYIPPGTPHFGETVETSLNYSIGFRAPKQDELLSNFADFLIQSNTNFQRYSDPQLVTRNYNSDINQHEISDFRQLLSNLVNDDALFTDWLGENLSRSLHELDLPNERPRLKPEQIKQVLDQGHVFEKINGIRCVTLPSENGQMIFFIETEKFACSEAMSPFVKQLLCAPKFSVLDYQKLPVPEAILPLLASLVELGFWEIN